MRPSARIGVPTGDVLEGEVPDVLAEDVFGEVVDEETRNLVVRACAAADASTEKANSLCDRLEQSKSPANIAEVVKA